jgi:hypothetical protein
MNVIQASLIWAGVNALEYEGATSREVAWTLPMTIMSLPSGRMTILIDLHCSWIVSGWFIVAFDFVEDSARRQIQRSAD